MATHKHKCTKCKRVWEHDPSTFKTGEEYDAAHVCRCGRTVIVHYCGPDAPMAETIEDQLREFDAWVADLIAQIQNKGIAA